MIDTRKRRAVVFLMFLLLFAAFVTLTMLDQRQRCLEVEILTQQEPDWLQEYQYRDYSSYLLYNGQKAPVDTETSTIYIAQDIGSETKAKDLQGSLRLSSSRHRIVFAQDAAFENLAEAAARNHPFRLYVTDGSGEYMQYDVVFTTLPVLRIQGELFGYDQKDREVNQGAMCLWTPVDPDTGHYSVKESNLQWHLRGGWSANQEKKPWKLSLKKKTGTNKNVSLLGLGSDDDWLLNPMNLDDTKLKEQLFIQLWNQRSDQVSWNPPMSRGEYIEVVMNGRYMGLFLLQRRIDGKFLGLAPEDVLMKGSANWDAPSAQVAYEIVDSNLTDEASFRLMEGIFSGNDLDMVNLDNYLDVSLFLQSATAVDNTDYKNMFYLLKHSDGGYQMQLLPWDTDMSWGTIWRGDGFVYDFEESLQRMALRREYDRMCRLYPDLDQQMAFRWLELREELLTMDTVSAILETEQHTLDISGARKRDQERWGLFYQGEDSLENLYKIVESRWQWLDDYYSQYLP